MVSNFTKREQNEEVENMTVEEINSSTKEVLTPGDLAGVLQCDPQSIRVRARQRPELLGFPVIVMGNRVKIPRRAFLKHIGEEVAG